MVIADPEREPWPPLPGSSAPPREGRRFSTRYIRLMNPPTAPSSISVSRCSATPATRRRRSQTIVSESLGLRARLVLICPDALVVQYPEGLG